MRTSATLFLMLAAMSACAARPAVRTAPPVHYACGGIELVRTGDQLRATTPSPEAASVPRTRGWTDGEGDHFVTFPTSATDVEVTEYVVPADPRRDALERHYDASRGLSRVDWRMTRQRTCLADGGYNDAFARWINGSSLDDVASQLDLDGRSQARDLIHEALVNANRRYYSDRR